MYVQLGETEEVPPAEGSRAKKPKIVKPKRASLPAGVQPSGVTLSIALKLLALPREVGTTPAGEKIQANNGRFGPYIQVGATFVSIKAPDDVFTISQDRAVELYETSGKKAIALGLYGKTEVYVKKGRFGYFLAYKKDKFPIPKTTDIETFKLADAIALLEFKLAKPTVGATKKATASVAKKTTTTASSSVKKALSATKVVKGKTTRTASKASAVRGKATTTTTKATVTKKKSSASSAAAASFHAATGF